MVATPGVTARLPESLFAAPRLWCEPPLSDAARPPALLPLDLLPDLRSSSSWEGEAGRADESAREGEKNQKLSTPIQAKGMASEGR